MAKTREVYFCSACRARSSQWRGQCSACGAWNSLERLAVTASRQPPAAGRAAPSGRAGRLADAPEHAQDVFSSGMEDLDRILGNGFVPGATLLVGGEPGIGKSTLLLQTAGAVAASGRLAVYVSGEESLPQVRARADRLGLLHDNLHALATTRTDDVLPLLEGAEPPAFLVLDSVQTLVSAAADGLPGNVSQVRAVASEMAEYCKKSNTVLVLVGHVTKEGNLAGPRLLEHMVDTVISLEGDRQEECRLLRVLKNRFGPNQEMLVFRMTEKGLQLVRDPSTYFLGARDAGLSGTAVVMTVDGRQPLAVEIQALAAKSYLAVPRRAGLGFDVNRLHLLLAVLEKRLHLSFAQMDIYAKVGGGMRLMEPGMDLPLVAAFLSSYYDVPLPEKAVFWGEVDLNGQIRPVAGHAAREIQARRLGYSPILCPASGQEDGRSAGLRTLSQLRQVLFSSRKGVRAERH